MSVITNLEDIRTELEKIYERVNDPRLGDAIVCLDEVINNQILLVQNKNEEGGH